MPSSPGRSEAWRHWSCPRLPRLQRLLRRNHCLGRRRCRTSRRQRGRHCTQPSRRRTNKTPGFAVVSPGLPSAHFDRKLDPWIAGLRVRLAFFRAGRAIGQAATDLSERASSTRAILSAGGLLEALSIRADTAFNDRTLLSRFAVARVVAVEVQVWVGLAAFRKWSDAFGGRGIRVETSQTALRRLAGGSAARHSRAAGCARCASRRRAAGTRCASRRCACCASRRCAGCASRRNAARAPTGGAASARARRTAADTSVRCAGPRGASGRGRVRIRGPATRSQQEQSDDAVTSIKVSHRERTEQQAFQPGILGEIGVMNPTFRIESSRIVPTRYLAQ